MSSYCPSIKMPEARKESSRKRPYDVPVRPESIIDLNYEKTFFNKVQAFIAIGRSMNALGHTLKLKEKYMTASYYLDKASIKYVIVEDETSYIQADVTH